MKMKPALIAMRRGVLPLFPLIALFAAADMYHNAERSKFFFYMIPVTITALINFAFIYWRARRAAEKEHGQTITKPGRAEQKTAVIPCGEKASPQVFS